MEEQIIKVNQINIGSIIVATCVGYNHEGYGICRVNGERNGETLENFTIFVNEMLEGEKGKIQITKVNKTFAYANVVKIFNDTRSMFRVIPPCKNYQACGGCNIMHFNYTHQLQFKTNLVKDTFKKIGGFDEPNVNTTIGMVNPKNYRNKVQVPFRQTRYKTLCGFFAKDSHQVVPFDECEIQPSISSEIVNFVRNLINEYKVEGYNESTNTGIIRHVLVRTTSDLNKIMLVLVITSNALPSKDEIIKKIINRYPVVKSIILNINNKVGNTILGEKCITIFGDDYITDELCGMKFRIGPKSFYQVNHAQTEKLYSKAIEVAKLTKDDVLIDAYCGIGTIGLVASSKVKEVYGVEIVEEAIKNAKYNAKINKVTNATYVCNKAEDQIVKWYEEGIKADVIVVDPPRKGCDIRLLETINKMNIKRVVYVSCDVATLARDARILVDRGYSISTIQPVDMFPQTSNVECVVCLERR